MANPKARRAPAVLASLIVLAAAGGLSWFGAREAADFLERQASAEVGAALRDAGHGWAEVAASGLQVRLTGTAPDEIQRFRAKSRAESVVEPGRVVDEMTVAARAALGTPGFKIQLLRNDDGISIVGLVPAVLDRDAMVTALQRQTNAKSVSDLVETADYAIPEGWESAFSYGLKAAQLARHGKVSIAPGKVVVEAITDSPGEKAGLEEALRRARPADVQLDARIKAPRPVMAPFTLRFVKSGEAARFDACAADNQADRDRILAAGVAAGIPGAPQCALALGTPSPVWADAAVAGIRAVQALGQGSVTLSDTDVALFAPAGVDAARFDEAVGRLEGGLPAGFTLTSEHEKPSDPVPQPAEFSASRSGAGVILRGRISDERMRDAVESMARARFGHVDSALRLDQGVPDGWTLRAIAALEALAGLDQGAVTVTPQLIRLSGVAGSQTASDTAAARLSQRLGAGARYELSIRYDRWLDPLLALPSGAECVDRLNAVMTESEIGFEPGKSIIAGDPQPTLKRLGQAMADCGAYRIEIGGHTDSQGSDALNAELSRARAQAVLDAMAADGIDTARMQAKGHGETQPIAANDTDAGREANRRIEFRLLAEAPAVVETPRPVQKVSGVTDSPGVAVARAARAASDAATGAVAPVLGPPVAVPAMPVETPAMSAATAAVQAVARGRLLLSAIDAATLPALETAFPDPEAGADGLLVAQDALVDAAAGVALRVIQGQAAGADVPQTGQGGE
ncbi:MAG: OmpA family protein [Paracoccus sp. (in: a-proteobacteria)]|uniref:OmpA family protein n=1 Tax=Paracoccus sp. TaxID=267 RepID=UPI0039E3451B